MLRIAYIIQIVVSLIYFFIGCIFLLDNNAYDLFPMVNINNNNTIFGLLFIVLAVFCFCKIPLITVMYYSARARFRLRILFIIALILVCYMEFDTVMQGMELGLRERFYNLYLENKSRHDYLWTRNIIICFIVVTASPIFAFIGFMLSDKNKN